MLREKEIKSTDTIPVPAGIQTQDVLNTSQVLLLQRHCSHGRGVADKLSLSTYGMRQKKWCRHSECYSKMRLQCSSCHKPESFFRELKVPKKQNASSEERWVRTHIGFRNAVQLRLRIFQGCVYVFELCLCLPSCVSNGKAEQQRRGFRKRMSFLKMRTVYNAAMCSLCAAHLLWVQCVRGMSIWSVVRRSWVPILAGPRTQLWIHFSLFQQC